MTQGKAARDDAQHVDEAGRSRTIRSRQPQRTRRRQSTLIAPDATASGSRHALDGIRSCPTGPAPTAERRFQRRPLMALCTTATVTPCQASRERDGSRYRLTNIRLCRILEEHADHCRDASFHALIRSGTKLTVWSLSTSSQQIPMLAPSFRAPAGYARFGGGTVLGASVAEAE